MILVQGKGEICHKYFKGVVPLFRSTIIPKINLRSIIPKINIEFQNSEKVYTQ